MSDPTDADVTILSACPDCGLAGTMLEVTMHKCPNPPDADVREKARELVGIANVGWPSQVELALVDRIAAFVTERIEAATKLARSRCNCPNCPAQHQVIQSRQHHRGRSEAAQTEGQHTGEGVQEKAWYWRSTGSGRYNVADERVGEKDRRVDTGSAYFCAKGSNRRKGLADRRATEGSAMATEARAKGEGE